MILEIVDRESDSAMSPRRGCSKYETGAKCHGTIMVARHGGGFGVGALLMDSDLVCRRPGWCPPPQPTAYDLSIRTSATYPGRGAYPAHADPRPCRAPNQVWPTRAIASSRLLSLLGCGGGEAVYSCSAASREHTSTSSFPFLFPPPGSCPPQSSTDISLALAHLEPATLDWYHLTCDSSLLFPLLSLIRPRVVLRSTTIMAEPEKSAATTDGTVSPTHSPYEAPIGEEVGPSGPPWMYRTFKIGPWTTPYYASPRVQLLVVAFTCFLCPGMFNAINGLGAGGQVNAHDANNTNTALYATFAGVGFFAGSICNRIGIKLTLSFGGFGYFIYTSAWLSYNHNQNSGYLIFSGALLGLCAGMLWAAQGAVMMSYPLEESKGKYISWFWGIFNLGAVIGGLVYTLTFVSAVFVLMQYRFLSPKTCTQLQARSTTVPTLHLWSSCSLVSSSPGVWCRPSMSSVLMDPRSSS